MIHNDVLYQLQLLVKTTASPLVEVSETPAELPQWTTGDKLPAHVLASLPNGRFQVSVGDQILDMNLPKNTQPGDNIELVYVANQPRLTFVLSRETQASTKASAAAATAAARGDIPLAAAENGAKAPVTLSDTAKFLGALLQKVAERQNDPQALSLKANAVLTAPPADSRQFAVALRGALSQSGLFYESHQAQWVAGERSLTALLREPQGTLSQQVAPANSPVIDKSQGSTIPTNLRADVPPVANESQKAQVLVNLQPDSSSAQAGKTAELVHPDTLPLIQQQLQTLDTHQLVWQGQVWPGQHMDWVVEERKGRGGSNEGEEPINWNTKLRLQLPRLGDVSAALAFTSKGLRISLSAADASTTETLKIAQGKLQSSLDAAGLQLLGLSVERSDRA
jgi:hypothetical protein